MRLRILQGRARHSVRAVLRLRQLVAGRRRAWDCAPYLVMLLVFICQRSPAQLAPADDFFHGGALFYLSNNIPAALDRVTNGLALYPDDPKLKKLEELLKQQSQQQQQQQNQQQNNQSKEDQQKDQKPDQKQKSQDQKASDKDKLQEQQKKETQEKKDQKKSEQQQAKKSDDQKQPDQKPEDQQQANAVGQMTPQEAKQLLDSQKNDEMMMPVSRKDKATNPQRVLKDW